MPLLYFRNESYIEGVGEGDSVGVGVSLGDGDGVGVGVADGEEVGDGLGVADADGVGEGVDVTFMPIALILLVILFASFWAAFKSLLAALILFLASFKA